MLIMSVLKLFQGMIESDPYSRLPLNTCLDIICSLTEDQIILRSNKKSLLSAEFDHILTVTNVNSKKSLLSASSFSKYGSFVFGKHISYCTSEDYEYPLESSKDGTSSKDGSRNHEENKYSNSFGHKQESPST